jgi:hypothetical protein
MNRFVWLRENGRLIPQKWTEDTPRHGELVAEHVPEAHDWPTCLDYLARLYPPPQPDPDVVDTRTD